MPRSSMDDLITRLRAFTGDPAGPSETWNDDELEAFLDERRTDVVEAQLRYRPTTGSTLLFHDLFAPRRWWEDSAVLSGASGNALTPTGADLLVGHWTFSSGTQIPVYITGSFYDMYGSAQAVCEAWAARVAREFDFATDQQTFDRTGKREGLLAVAAVYARKAVQPGMQPPWRSATW